MSCPHADRGTPSSSETTVLLQWTVRFGPVAPGFSAIKNIASKYLGYHRYAVFELEAIPFSPTALPYDLGLRVRDKGR
jgi:hypothetical protein